MDELLSREFKFDQIVKNQELPVVKPSSNGCNGFRHVVARSEVGPGAFFSIAKYYCSIKDNIFEITLINWEGDPDQERFQELALAVALSLRTS